MAKCLNISVTDKACLKLQTNQQLTSSIHLSDSALSLMAERLLISFNRDTCVYEFVITKKKGRKNRWEAVHFAINTESIQAGRNTFLQQRT